MFVSAVSWATIASLATAAGTLVLAVATFSAVRSGNRSARVAEQALQEQRRPVLAPSRLEDPPQKIMFLGGLWITAPGGGAGVEHVAGVVYLTISLRNVGSGIAVCQGWTASPQTPIEAGVVQTALDQFRPQSRDLYVPSGDIGMWQGALRHPDDQMRAQIATAIETKQPITVDLLYSDQVGLQRTISRFGLYPVAERWIASLNRHWYLDWEGPRPEAVTLAATDMILHEEEAAAERRALDGAEQPETRLTEDSEGDPYDDFQSDSRTD